MERHIECGSRSWYGSSISSFPILRTLTGKTGPAHAVYFATYEAVKHAMGGNNGNEHHPLAAGKNNSRAHGDGSLMGGLTP